jgi:MoaD family protein
LRVNIKIFPMLRDATGASEGMVEVNGDTVGDVIDALITQYGDKFGQELFKPDGNIKPSIKLLINESLVDTAAPLQYEVKDGDTLSFIPAMFGG